MAKIRLKKSRAIDRLASGDASAERIDDFVSADGDSSVSGFENVDQIMVSKIDLDPDQPRRLGIDSEMLFAPDKAPDAETRAKIDSIYGLAETIDDHGQQALVEVYRDGNRFKLIAGERRYWAGRLKQKDFLWAKVLERRPRRLRLKQYLENAQRVNFTLPETMDSLISIVEEARAIGEPVTTMTAFQKLVGFGSSSRASRWWAVLSGPEDVRAALRDGRIKHLSVAERLARIDADREREDGIAAVELAGGSHAEADAIAHEVAEQTQSKRQYKRPTPAAPKSASLGGVTDARVARVILERLAGADAYQVGDDLKDLVRAIRAVIADLERDLAE